MGYSEDYKIMKVKIMKKKTYNISNNATALPQKSPEKLPISFTNKNIEELQQKERIGKLHSENFHKVWEGLRSPKMVHMTQDLKNSVRDVQGKALNESPKFWGKHLCFCPISASQHKSLVGLCQVQSGDRKASASFANQRQADTLSQGIIQSLFLQWSNLPTPTSSIWQRQDP